MIYNILKEYFFLIKENISNIKLIMTGFYKSLIFFLLKREDQEAIKKRRLVCKSCFGNSLNAPYYKSYRVDNHCTICTCNISAKTANLKENCLIKLWENDNK